MTVSPGCGCRNSVLASRRQDKSRLQFGQGGQASWKNGHLLEENNRGELS